MPCYHPKLAWLYYRGGRPSFSTPEPDQLWAYRHSPIPCGRCIGCQVRTARDWSIRCLLESEQHDQACWVTLTYDSEYLPRLPNRTPTLHKPDLSGYLKRLRARVHPDPVRFFGSGEYGDRNGRPHFHVILFGLPQHNRHIEEAWPFGFARADPLSPAAIAYTAGYAQKKIGAAHQAIESFETDLVDPETGEVVGTQRRELKPVDPFRHMSRGGRNGVGIGGYARRFPNSWRRNAIWRGSEVPVPRYLNAAWKDRATESQLEQLRAELQSLPAVTHERREAGEKIAHAKYQLQTSRRSL